MRRLRHGSSDPGNRPLVSVLVTTGPGDERFLDACLESIRAQTYSELDIVVAAEGNSPAIRAICRRHTSQDVRITYLTQAAANLREAETLVLGVARGEFLQFVRGGDQLPPRGVSFMVDALVQSGSDLAIGRRKQVVALSRAVREIRDPLHDKPSRANTMESCPAVVTDLGLENRMFRTSFWRAGHQDWSGAGASTAEIVLRATMAARSFDVLEDLSYRDMNRSVGTPVGSLDNPLSDLAGWLAEQQVTMAAVAAVGAAEVTDFWVASVLDADLQALLDRSETASDAEWAMLKQHAVGLRELAPSAADGIRAESRVKLWLLTSGRQDQVADLMAQRWFENGNKPTTVEGDVVYAQLPGFRDEAWGVPDDAYAMSPEETGLEVVLRDLNWLDGRHLELTFYVWIDFVGYAEPGHIEIYLVDAESGERTQLPTDSFRDPSVNHFAEHRYQDYSWGAVRVTLDSVALTSGLGGNTSKKWNFDVVLEAGQLRRQGGVSRRDERGSAGLLSSRLLAPRRVGESMISIGADQDHTVSLVAQPAGPAQLVEAKIDGRRMTGRFSIDESTPVSIQVSSSTGKVTSADVEEGPDGWDFTVHLPAIGTSRQAAATPATWTLRVLTADGLNLALDWLADVDEQWTCMGTGQLVLARSGLGTCELVEALGSLAIDQIKLVEAETLRLKVTGRWLGTAPLDASLTLTSTRTTVLGRRVDSETSVQWEFPLEFDEWGHGLSPVPTGRYGFGLTCGSHAGRVQFAGGVVSTMLDVIDGPTYSVRPFRGGREIGVLLARPVGAEDRGPFNQRQLQAQFFASTRPLSPDAVYLQSYNGASATDSQIAIHWELRRRHPEWTLYWGVHDRSSWVPEDAEPVVINSREWYDALECCKYLVNNIDFDRWFTPRAGQEFLQTFHGYPAKSMGIRLWEAKSFTPRRIAAELARTADDWDLILTPTPEMDEHYRREYRYDGRIHSAGYPRDDQLLGPDASTIRETTRRLLGIEPGQTVVLYAPTWRDDLATNYRTAEMADHIDLEDASVALGPEFVFLMRGHRFHGKLESRDSGAARLIDVTHYPEINDLILAADAAVLDYSSLRFDFALTRRPMIFLVPDLSTYTGSVRGFLYDFASSAPGPLLDTPDQVVAALRDLPGVEREFASAYETFHRTYNYLQDGRAAERVVSAFFEPGSG